MVRLRTERLLLRAFEPSDSEDVFNYASKPEWAQYLGLHIPHPYTEQDAVDFVTHATGLDDAVDLFWAIEYRRRVVGSISLSIEQSAGRVSVGYGVGLEWWGQGLTTEALQAVVNWVFTTTDLVRVYARADARNIASTRVMRKAGMRKEGTLRRHRVARDGLVDEDWYGILREDWLSEGGVAGDA